MTTAAALLADDELPPYERFNTDGAAPILLICDHASRRVPRRLHDLGLDERELSRHIGWDIGAADVTRHMEFAAVMDPQTERLTRYLAHLTDLGILNCQNPTLAAHQFMGILNEFSLWPWMIGRERALASDEDVVEEAVRMFLQRYRPPRRQMVRGRGTGARRRSRTPAGQS